MRKCSLRKLRIGNYERKGFEPISKSILGIGMPPGCHSRAGGNPCFSGLSMDPRIREGDKFFAITDFEIGFINKEQNTKGGVG
jgi:hypothetical protein